MKTKLQCKRNAVENFSPAGANQPQGGYARSEVLVTAAFLGVVIAFLYGLFAMGLGHVRATRENVCASRVLLQRAEALRLFSDSQVSKGGQTPTAHPMAGGLTAAHPAHMRPVTVTLCWTNYVAGQPIVHSREVPARLARNGMPKYIWGAL